MHVLLPLWLVPLTLTVLFWAAAIFWPSASEDGTLFPPLGLIFWVLVRFAVAVASTLLVWLAYFIWLFVAGAS
ncbi:hypothetical protein LJR234_000360 [Mesorhizobium amorphae]|uniref:hypothetical protein n=1 Tax=Mesorhizobium amorphae TaxID=71433 RepID=UPI003ECE3ED1